MMHNESNEITQWYHCISGWNNTPFFYFCFMENAFKPMTNWSSQIDLVRLKIRHVGFIIGFMQKKATFGAVVKSPN